MSKLVTTVFTNCFTAVVRRLFGEKQFIMTEEYKENVIHQNLINSKIVF